MFFGVFFFMMEMISLNLNLSYSTVLLITEGFVNISPQLAPPSHYHKSSISIFIVTMFKYDNIQNILNFPINLNFFFLFFFFFFLQ